MEREDRGLFLGAMGPLKIYGWEQKGTVTGDMDVNSLALLFVVFRDGTLSITAREHVERVLAGEDGTKGVFNLFCACYPIVRFSLSNKNGSGFIVHELLNSRKDAEKLTHYVVDIFDEQWNLAMDQGKTWSDVEEKLKCQFDENSLSGFRQSRYEPALMAETK